MQGYLVSLKGKRQHWIVRQSVEDKEERAFTQHCVRQQPLKIASILDQFFLINSSYMGIYSTQIYTNTHHMTVYSLVSRVGEILILVKYLQSYDIFLPLCKNIYEGNLQQVQTYLE